MKKWKDTQVQDGESLKMCYPWESKLAFVAMAMEPIR